MDSEDTKVSATTDTGRGGYDVINVMKVYTGQRSYSREEIFSSHIYVVDFAYLQS
jgi:hypothetical protein